jgi:hypothetical protein
MFIYLLFYVNRQITPWPNEKGEKDKQRSMKSTT